MQVEATTSTLIQPIFVEIGLIGTLLLGWFCETFLEKSVKAKPKIGAHEADRGGKQLGVLERLLFFGSFLLGQYAAAGGWLLFKGSRKVGSLATHRGSSRR